MTIERRPAQGRIVTACDWLEDAALVAIFAGTEGFQRDWQEVALCVRKACDSLADPEAEAELWEHLSDVRDAIAKGDGQATGWLLDAAVESIRRGDLWPTPMPEEEL